MKKKDAEKLMGGANVGADKWSMMTPSTSSKPQGDPRRFTWEPGDVVVIKPKGKKTEGTLATIDETHDNDE